MQNDKSPVVTTEDRERHQIIIDLEVGDDPTGILMLVENLLQPRGICLISMRSVPGD